MTTLTEIAEAARRVETNVKERPILFSGAMVRAILSGQDHPGAYWFPHRRDELEKENCND